MWRPSTLAKRFSRAQALPAEPGDRDKFSAVISGGWEDRCDIGHLATNILGRNLEGQIDDLNPVTSENPIRRSGGWIDDRGGNSLFLEKFSLIRLWKFPVPLRREFGCKLLNLRVDRASKSRWMAGFCKI